MSDATVSAAERATERVLRHLHTTDGWAFVEYVKYTDFTNCPACGGRMAAGVKITHADHGETVVGKGVVEKYLTAVELPRKTNDNTVTLEPPAAAPKASTPTLSDGAAKPSRKGTGKGRKSSAGVEELPAEAQALLDDAGDVPGVGEIDLDALASALKN